MRASAILTTAGLILIAASAAACSGGSGTTAAPASSPAGAASATGSSAPAAAAGSATKLDVCGTLTAAMAAQITGTAFTTAKSSGVEGVIFDCEYGGPGGALLQVSVETQNGPSAYDAIVSALKAVSSPPDAVSGVGDEAFSEPNPDGNAGSAGASSVASFGAVFGDTFIKIGGLTYVTAAQGTRIAEELHSKL
ncbi:MAG TPA: hypothetical protein VGH88_09115 [Streptosporangiaceae bacterium]|jgi:hypothetical protein